MGSGLGQEESCPASRSLGPGPFCHLLCAFGQIPSLILTCLICVMEIKSFPTEGRTLTESRLGFSSGSNTHALTRWLPTRVEEIMTQYFSTMWKPRWASGKFYPLLPSDCFMFAFLVGPFEMKLGCVGGVLMVGKVDGHNSRVLFTMPITSLSIWKVLNKHLLNWIEYYCLTTN